MAKGWAIQDKDGNILIKTVSDTKLAAVVNWLVIVNIYLPKQGDGTFMLFELFANTGEKYGFKAIEVNITQDDGNEKA